jgi:iron(III) transport system substrate-binding protein
MLKQGLAAAFGIALLAGAQPARAQGELVLYCSVQEEWCRPMAQAFERATGIKVAMTRKSSGETYAQIKAESSNPRGDVWWGGTGDPHLQAAEENLTEEYRSPQLANLQPWAVKQAEQSKFRTVGIYAGALGYSFNTQQLARRNLPEPKCWADLAKPEYKDEVQVADPNSSGTAYTKVATLVQLMGEAKAFEFMRAMHRNVNQYTKSGAAPARAAATGETLIGITFLHDGVAQAVGGAPLKIVPPCEGTGYEIGSMSILRGARNLAAAQRFYDWALSAPAQLAASQEAKKLQTMANRGVPLTEGAPSMATARIIDYDNARFGASAERRRLLARWDREVGALPR